MYLLSVNTKVNSLIFGSFSSFSLDPQALYELVKCNYNAEEALRRLHFNVKVFSGKKLPVVLHYFFQPTVLLI